MNRPIVCACNHPLQSHGADGCSGAGYKGCYCERDRARVMKDVAEDAQSRRGRARGEPQFAQASRTYS